ncbi:CHAD domain-containing protein [Acetobacter sp. TBRC 12305]|uniref:CHAD domain-containing protein n=1 Tax=Acetobacter garciniae TaxID=2817435 RepID=A0A939KMM7_9PROT|nr:CYTH and CHAD domain-containing protein [Acetobacter garciniae]MBO1325493.1 CHAD domain-containing protein [Acetobacter garciniae]MBX0345335.1 CHAD domain-containing protein [Acetobacter garciniae]
MTAPTSPPQEIELKLLFSAPDRPGLDRHPALCDGLVSGVVHHHLLTTYYDTPALALYEKGLSLRVRQSGGAYTQTLKSDAAGGGLAASRDEWAWPVRTNRPDTTLLAKTPAAVFGPALAEKLMPVLVSDIRRSVHLVAYGGAVIEAAIDEGAVRAGGGEEPVRELELELKEGPVLQVYCLALRLLADLPLRIGVETKAGRGYRLLRGGLPEPVAEPVVLLAPETPTEDAFRMIVRSQLAVLIGNQPAAEAGQPDGIHDMRVAIRKLRTVLRLFTPRLAPPELERFEEALQRLGQVLGVARDWDVFCLQTLPAAFDPRELDECPQLVAAAEEKRAAAHEDLHAELSGPAPTMMALELMAWVEDTPFVPGSAADPDPLCAFVPKRLDRFARKVARRGRGVGHLDPKGLHTLRKALKRLRYSADYFTAFYPARHVKPYLKLGRGLQSALGEINDAAVAATLADSLALAHPNLASFCADIVQRSHKRRKKSLHDLPRLWKDFHKTDEFWR